MLIKESYTLAATTVDVLAAPSRLNAIPGDGVLTLEISTTDSDVSNNVKATLQLPDGSVPFEDLTIPANGYSTADNVLHDDTAVQVSMQVEKGGHVLLSIEETGTVALTLIVATLEF